MPLAHTHVFSSVAEATCTQFAGLFSYIMSKPQYHRAEVGGCERKDATLPFATPLVHAPTGTELQNPLSYSRNIVRTASHATGGHSRVKSDCQPCL